MAWRRSHRFVNGYWLGHYEVEVQEAIASELRPGDGFFDIGANAGFFTLVARRAVGSGGWCVAFEPDPDSCQSVKSQVELNGLTKCTVLQQAVAEAPGFLDFVRSTPGSSVGHLSPRDGEQGERVRVEVVTIDAACEKYGNPRLVKMDIEGAEFRALQGAKRTIEEIRPTWLIELHGTDVAEQVREVLYAARYRFFSLNGHEVPERASLPHHVLARPLEMAGLSCQKLR